MNIKKWLFGHFGFISSSGEEQKKLTIGSLVKTEFGVGEVVGGSLNVKYKSNKKLPHRGRGDQKNNLTHSHNVEKVELI